MEQVIAYIATAIMGLGAVAAYMKYIKLAAAVVNMVDDTLEGLKDGKLTEAEVKKIASGYAELKAAYKAIKKK